MKVAEITIEQLEEWVQNKLPTIDQSEPVQLHALAHGFELRCGDLVLQLRPYE